MNLSLPFIGKKNRQAQAERKTQFYEWVGTNNSGFELKGKIEATSELDAKVKLRNKGILPKKLKRVREGGLFSRKVKTHDIAVFIRQLSTMLSSGVPLVRAFSIIAESASIPEMRAMIVDIRNHVESGEPLHAAFRRYPKHFNDLFCNLVEAGEKSGALETVLGRLAEYMEKMESIRGRIKKAMVYPVAVMTVAAGVTTLLLLFVVPQFEEIFKSYGAELPFLTQMVVDMSKVLRANFLIFSIATILAIVAFIEARKRSYPFRLLIDKAMLKIPIFGPLILDKIAVSRFVHTLSIMLKAGVPMVHALANSAKTAGNLVYEEAITKIQKGVAEGERLGRMVRSVDVFSDFTAQLIEIGEESGSLDAMLDKIGEFYDEEVDNTVASLSSLMEPVIMVVLGLTVGVLVLAMYMPIFKLGSAV